MLTRIRVFKFVWANFADNPAENPQLLYPVQMYTLSWQKIISTMFIVCFVFFILSHLRIFHSCEDVNITDEKLQFYFLAKIGAHGHWAVS